MTAAPAKPEQKAAFEKAQRLRPAGETRKEFPAVWLADATPQIDSPEILKGLIGVGTLALIYGPSGSGKSFWTADMVLHIALGLPWRGRRVRQFFVAYIATEAGASILKRFAPARDRLLGEAHEGAIPFVILTRGPNLLNGVDTENLMAQLRALAIQAGMPLGVVVFDTLSRSIPGGDENKSEDMTRVIEIVDRIRDELNASAIFVHHSGKDATKGMRGHSALFAAADVVIALNDKVATVEKVRDGVAGEQFPFRLEVIELGSDADGDPVTTCILEPTDAGTGEPIKRKKLTANTQVVLDALRTALDQHGETLPATSVLPHARAVKVDKWQDAYARIRPIRPDLPTDEAKRERNARRMAFRRAQDELQATRTAGTEAGYWWTHTRT